MSLFAKGATPGQPYWWEDVTWPDLPTDLPAQVDLLVIGAGYTGLSAAIAAQDAGASVAVIDAGTPGKGASSRNGGMVGAHPRLGWDTLKARYGRAAADGLYAEAAGALDWVRDLVAREGIDCDFTQTGRVQLAYTGSHHETQKRVAGQVAEKGGVPCEVLSREAVSAEIATPLYKGGMLFPNHCALHPAKYYLGMLAAALRRDIPVVPDCPAQAVSREGAAHVVQTPRGTVRAGKVVLATNGYTSGPFGWFARRVFPLPSFLIATEALSPNLIGELAPGRRMMVETRARFSYFRVSPDGSRILFGGRAAMVHVDIHKAAARLRDTMAEIWPVLRDVKLSHAWSGNTGYTFGHMPHVGAQDGIHYALGYSGGGTVLAPYLGRKAALQALGLPGGETAFTATTLSPRWYHPGGAPVFLQGANMWYRNWVDRQEKWASRKG